MQAGGKRAASTLRKAPKLGIIRLDYSYPAAPGDIDHPASFPYEVVYRVVPGLTFEMCQKNTLTPAVMEQYKDAIRWLEAEKVSGITGDCGFMMWLQPLVRTLTTLPVFKSPICQLPAVTCAYANDEKIAIFTANSTTLEPMLDLIRTECGVDTEHERYKIVGCQDVAGFNAVADGTKVDYQKVAPGIVELAQQVLKEHPDTRAFLFECTELPPFSNAVRAATGVPVYDAITMSDSFMSGVLENKRFGNQGLIDDWDGKQEAYEFGDNLTPSERREGVFTKRERV